MQSFRTEPFLWIHLSGLAALPLALELVWLGLAVGEPLLPVWIEFLIVGAIGIVPVLWMQLTRVFDIFSILVVAIAPDQLSDEQCRILSLFDKKTNKILTIAAGIFMLWVLWQVYRFAPVAAPVASIVPGWRLAGLLGAGVAFLASNLFLQVPLSVAQVLSTSQAEFDQTEPYPADKIPESFTIPGIKVKGILPSLTENEVTVTAADSSQLSFASESPSESGRLEREKDVIDPTDE
jgi:hypothetical protein